MKIALAVVLSVVIAAPALAAGSKSVRPYVKKDGTFVQGHMRSAPNSTRYDNYNARNSIYGTNPYTGQKGSQRDEFSSPPAYNQGRQGRR